MFWIAALIGISAFAADLKRDITFSSPGGLPLTLDASIPEGKGPHPAVIIVHGSDFEWQVDEARKISP